MIAYGIMPSPFTFGHDKAEFDKVLVTALLSSAPVVFTDNINGVLLRSETLASVLTQRPSQVRILGHSTMLPLNCAAFITLTGNGLTVAQDLARRFIWVHIDPKLEDPESRLFAEGFLDEIKGRRIELLSAALTILRYGRQHAGKLGRIKEDGTVERGLAMGSFEQWVEWVRDPLLALGCVDRVIGTRQAKAADPERQEISELFTLWNKYHGEDPVAARELHDEVQKVLNPRKLATQYMTRRLQRMAGMRHAGFVLTQTLELHGRGRWTPPTFKLSGGPSRLRGFLGGFWGRFWGVSGAANASKTNKFPDLKPETPKTPRKFFPDRERKYLCEKGKDIGGKKRTRRQPAV